jgi:serine/threonine protein kinase
MLAGYPPFYDQNPMKLYENIMTGRIKYPSYFDPLAKDLLQKLLTSDLSKRYGNLKAGSADIFNHPWYSEVNWERLERREIDAPYIPPIRPGGGDASQFERYDEEAEEYGDFNSKDVYGHLFLDF